jgi:hypothetical protein
MATYFVRSILAGLGKLALCSFLIYSPLVYCPGGFAAQSEQFQMMGHLSIEGRFQGTLASSWEYDKPWPFSYFVWLFDASETVGYDWETGGEIRRGIDLAIGDLRIKGSGVLTGDFGEYWDNGIEGPTSEIFGPVPGQIFVFLINLITALMAIATAQRLGRPRPYRVSATPTASALADWWHLHAASPSGVIIRRQWG